MTALKSASIVLLALSAVRATAAVEPHYSETQAKAGQSAYEEHCASCHGDQLEGIDISPPLVGQKFNYTWRGNSAELLSFHLRRMPPKTAGEPGSLGDDAYANILAYILKRNGFESGDTPLPSSMHDLARIEIPRLPGMQYEPDKPVEVVSKRMIERVS